MDKRTINERWDVTIKPANVEPYYINSHEAEAWYNGNAIYVPKNRIDEATGHILKESEIGKCLDKNKLLASKPACDRYMVRHIPKVGRIPAFALKREEFRSNHADDPDMHQSAAFKEAGSR
jgi:hypothetical protein